MDSKSSLATLDLLRDFVSKVLTVEGYMKNLIVDRVETPNKRLWALRESLKLDEASFARRLDMAPVEYHELERIGNLVPSGVLKKVSRVFAVPLDWLLCKQPMLPLPCASSSEPSRRH